MTQQFLIFTIVLLIFFVACSDKENDNKTKYKTDVKAFIKSPEKFNHANDKFVVFIEDNKNKIANNPKVTESIFQEILDKYKEGIKESEKVSNPFLDLLHPKLKTMYKDTLIRSIKTIIEYSERAGYSKAAEIDKEVYDIQKSFYSFVHENQDDINQIIIQ